MGDIRQVEASIKSLGAMEQISYTKKDGSGTGVFAKFNVECQIGAETHTYETPSWNKEKLAVGRRYLLDIEDKGEFTDSIRKIQYIGDDPGVNGSEPTPLVQEVKAEAIPEYMPTDAPRKRSLVPDFGSRFREYNTHARLAFMQATDRVKIYVHLMEEGKLVNSEGVKPDALTIATIQGWISDEIDKYWEEYSVRVPKDMIGEWEE